MDAMEADLDGMQGFDPAALGLGGDGGDFALPPEPVLGEEVDVSADKNGGILKTVTKLGDGFETPEKGDEVTAHYVGTLMDGTPFDSSRDRGTPFVFKIGMGQVIKGWDQGIATMRKGECATLVCAPDYAYGASGSPPKIPENATLKFDVELISWKSVKDISGDGGVIKKVLAEGSGYEKPSGKDEVTVTYKMDGAADETAQTFPADSAPCLGLSTAVPTMKNGERALLTLSPAYAEGLPGVAAGAGTTLADFTIVSWNKVEDVKDTDGAVVKKTLKQGSGYEKPNDGSTVKVRYSGRVQGADAPFETVDELEFKTDYEELQPVGLEKAICAMKQGEHAEVTIGPAWGFGDGSKDSVPAGSTTVYDVEVLGFTNAKESYSMSAEEKLEAVELKKAEGNAYFKAGKLERAVKRYDAALKIVEYDSGLSDEQKVLAKAAKVTLNNNLAMMHLKLKDYSSAIEKCDKALELEGSNVKALFRRAQAYGGRFDFEEANADVKKLLELDPKNRDALLYKKQLKAKIAEQDKKASKMFGAMFSGLAKGADLYDVKVPAEAPPAPEGGDDVEHDDKEQDGEEAGEEVDMATDEA